MYRGCNLESIRMDLVSACAREYRAFVIVCTVLVTFMTFWLGGRRSGAAEHASHTTGIRQSLQPNSNSELARTHASTKACLLDYRRAVFSWEAVVKGLGEAHVKVTRVPGLLTLLARNAACDGRRFGPSEPVWSLCSMQAIE